MSRVYVETSIPSYYFEARRAPKLVAWREATVRWWDALRLEHALSTSETTIEELRKAPSAKAVRMLSMLQDVEILPYTAQVGATAVFCVEHKLVPAETLADALHIAYCSVYRVEYLLTWNCRHLANTNKARHLQVLNKRLGLPVPTLVTPYHLLPEERP